MRHSWARRVKKDFKGTFTDNLVQCPSSDPPARLDDTVKVLCELKCTANVDVSELENFTSADGKKKLKTLHYDLEMIPSGAYMEFNFYIDDRKQASHNITAEYE